MSSLTELKTLIEFVNAEGGEPVNPPVNPISPIAQTGDFLFSILAIIFGVVLCVTAYMLFKKRNFASIGNVAHAKTSSGPISHVKSMSLRNAMIAVTFAISLLLLLFGGVSLGRAFAASTNVVPDKITAKVYPSTNTIEVEDGYINNATDNNIKIMKGDSDWTDSSETVKGISTMHITSYPETGSKDKYLYNGILGATDVESTYTDFFNKGSKTPVKYVIQPGDVKVADLDGKTISTTLWSDVEKYAIGFTQQIPAGADPNYFTLGEDTDPFDVLPGAKWKIIPPTGPLDKYESKLQIMDSSGKVIREITAKVIEDAEVRNKYEFAGWTVGMGEPITTGEGSIGGSTIFTANFKETGLLLITFTSSDTDKGEVYTQEFTNPDPIYVKPGTHFEVDDEGWLHIDGHEYYLGYASHGNKLEDWRINEEAITEGVLQGDTNFEAFFLINKYNINFSAGDNGGLTSYEPLLDVPYGTTYYVNDGKLTFVIDGVEKVIEAKPNENFEFDHWENQNGSKITNGTKNVGGDLQFTAIFTIKKFSVEFWQADGDKDKGQPERWYIDNVPYNSEYRVESNGNIQFKIGEVEWGTNVQAKPYEGYHWTKWTKNSSTATEEYSGNIIDNTKFYCHFDTDTFDVSFVSANQEYGYIKNGDDQGDCNIGDVEFGAEYTKDGNTVKIKDKSGAEHTITAINNPGYTFANWSIDPLKDTISKDTRFTANFIADVVTTVDVTATVLDTEQGSVTPDTLSKVEIGTKFSVDKNTIKFGGNVVITATAKAGYEFDHWEMNGSQAGVFDTIDSTHNRFVAFFKAKVFTISLLCGDGGSIFPSKQVKNVAYGTTVEVDKNTGDLYFNEQRKVIVTADEGYEFSQWLDDNLDPFTFFEVKEDTDFMCTFKAKTYDCYFHTTTQACAIDQSVIEGLPYGTKYSVVQETEATEAHPVGTLIFKDAKGNVEYAVVPQFEDGVTFKEWQVNDRPTLSGTVKDSMDFYIYANIPLKTIKISSSNPLQGSVDNPFIFDVAVGTPYLVSDNYLVVGKTKITATPKEGCVFSHWEFEGAEIPDEGGKIVGSKDILQFTAVFDSRPVTKYKVSFKSNDETAGSILKDDVKSDSYVEVPYGTSYHVIGNSVVVEAEPDVKFTCQNLYPSTYSFINWKGYADGQRGNITRNTVFEGVFERNIYTLEFNPGSYSVFQDGKDMSQMTKLSFQVNAGSSFTISDDITNLNPAVVLYRDMYKSIKFTDKDNKTHEIFAIPEMKNYGQVVHFTGWNIVGTHDAGKIMSNILFSPQIERNKYDVKFDVREDSKTYGHINNSLGNLDNIINVPYGVELRYFRDTTSMLWFWDPYTNQYLEGVFIAQLNDDYVDSHHFDSWESDDIIMEYTITGETSIYANFSVNMYNVHVNPPASSGGTVEYPISGQLDYEFPYGTNISVSLLNEEIVVTYNDYIFKWVAHANSSYDFSGWESNVEILSTRITQDLVFTPTFNTGARALSVNVDYFGEINSGEPTKLSDYAKEYAKNYCDAKGIDFNEDEYNELNQRPRMPFILQMLDDKEWIQVDHSYINQRCFTKGDLTVTYYAIEKDATYGDVFKFDVSGIKYEEEPKKPSQLTLTFRCFVDPNSQIYIDKENSVSVSKVYSFSYLQSFSQGSTNQLIPPTDPTKPLTKEYSLDSSKTGSGISLTGMFGPKEYTSTYSLDVGNVQEGGTKAYGSKFGIYVCDRNRADKYALSENGAEPKPEVSSFIETNANRTEIVEKDFEGASYHTYSLEVITMNSLGQMTTYQVDSYIEMTNPTDRNHNTFLRWDINLKDSTGFKNTWVDKDGYTHHAIIGSDFDVKAVYSEQMFTINYSSYNFTYEEYFGYMQTKDVVPKKDWVVSEQVKKYTQKTAIGCDAVSKNVIESESYWTMMQEGDEPQIIKTSPHNTIVPALTDTETEWGNAFINERTYYFNYTPALAIYDEDTNILTFDIQRPREDIKSQNIFPIKSTFLIDEENEELMDRSNIKNAGDTQLFGQVIPEKDAKIDPPSWMYSDGRWKVNPNRIVIKEALKDYDVIKGMANWFAINSQNSDNWKIESIEGLGYLNLTNVTDMSRLFASSSNRDYLKDIDVSNLGTSTKQTPNNLQTLRGMFEYQGSLTSVKLPTTSKFWSNCSDVSRMFYGCTSLSSFNVHDVGGTYFGQAAIDMTEMFFNCKNLTDFTCADSGFGQTDNINLNLSGMFALCSNLRNVNFSQDFGKNAKSLNSMFYGCVSLENIDFTKLNLGSRATCATYMFQGCSSLRTVLIPNIFSTTPWTRENPYATDIDYYWENFGWSVVGDMFDGCRAITKFQIGNGWYNVYVYSPSHNETPQYAQWLPLTMYDAWLVVADSGPYDSIWNKINELGRYSAAEITVDSGPGTFVRSTAKAVYDKTDKTFIFYYDDIQYDVLDSNRYEVYYVDADCGYIIGSGLYSENIKSGKRLLHENDNINTRNSDSLGAEQVVSQIHFPSWYDVKYNDLGDVENIRCKISTDESLKVSFDESFYRYSQQVLNSMSCWFIADCTMKSPFTSFDFTRGIDTTNVQNYVSMFGGYSTELNRSRNAWFANKLSSLGVLDSMVDKSIYEPYLYDRYNSADTFNTNLKSIDIQGLKIYDPSGMFANCKALNSIKNGTEDHVFDEDNLRICKRGQRGYTDGMFYNCASMTDFPCLGEVVEVYSCYFMYAGCLSMEKLNIYELSIINTEFRLSNLFSGDFWESVGQSHTARVGAIDPSAYMFEDSNRLSQLTYWLVSPDYDDYRDINFLQAGLVEPRDGEFWKCTQTGEEFFNVVQRYDLIKNFKALIPSDRMKSFYTDGDGDIELIRNVSTDQPFNINVQASNGNISPTPDQDMNYYSQLEYSIDGSSLYVGGCKYQVTPSKNYAFSYWQISTDNGATWTTLKYKEKGLTPVVPAGNTLQFRATCNDVNLKAKAVYIKAKEKTETEPAVEGSMTFYYDTSDHQSEVADDKGILFYINDNDETPGWLDVSYTDIYKNGKKISCPTYKTKVPTVEKVIFDSSFANYQSLQSMQSWFMADSNGKQPFKQFQKKNKNGEFVNDSPFEYVNTANLANVKYLFGGYFNANYDISINDFTTAYSDSSYDTSGTTIKNLDLTKFNLNNVDDWSWMFANAKALESIKFTTDVNDPACIANAKPKSVAGMFANCESLGTAAEIDGDFNQSVIGSELINSSECTDFSYLFFGCNHIEKIDLRNWDTSKVQIFMSENIQEKLSNLNHVSDSNSAASQKAALSNDVLKSIAFVFYDCTRLSDITWNTQLQNDGYSSGIMLKGWTINFWLAGLDNFKATDKQYSWRLEWNDFAWENEFVAGNFYKTDNFPYYYSLNSPTKLTPNDTILGKTLYTSISSGQITRELPQAKKLRVNFEFEEEDPRSPELDIFYDEDFEYGNKSIPLFLHGPQGAPYIKTEYASEISNILRSYTFLGDFMTVNNEIVAPNNRERSGGFYYDTYKTYEFLDSVDVRMSETNTYSLFLDNSPFVASLWNDPDEEFFRHREFTEGLNKVLDRFLGEYGSQDWIDWFSTPEGGPDDDRIAEYILYNQEKEMIKSYYKFDGWFDDNGNRVDLGYFKKFNASDYDASDETVATYTAKFKFSKNKADRGNSAKVVVNRNVDGATNKHHTMKFVYDSKAYSNDDYIVYNVPENSSVYDLPPWFSRYSAGQSGSGDLNSPVVLDDRIYNLLQPGEKLYIEFDRSFENYKDLRSMSCWFIPTISWTDPEGDILCLFDFSNSDLSDPTFKGLQNVPTQNLSNVTYMFGGFDGFYNYREAIMPSNTIDITGFDKDGNLTNLAAMFANCTTLNTIKGLKDLPWNKITNLSSFLYNCKNILGSQQNINKVFDGCNTGAVTDMSYMFAINGNLNYEYEDCVSNTFIYIPTSVGFDTSKVTNFTGLFKGYTNTKKITVKDTANKLNTKQAVNMSEMFRNCLYVESIDLSECANFNTYKVENTDNMFNLCTALPNTTDILNYFDFSSATSMQGMFWDCYELQEVSLNRGNNGSVITNAQNMFADCFRLKTVNLTNFYFANKTGSTNDVCSNMFYVSNTPGTTRNFNVDKIIIENSHWNYDYTLADMGLDNNTRWYNSQIGYTLSESYSSMEVPMALPEKPEVGKQYPYFGVYSKNKRIYTLDLYTASSGVASVRTDCPNVENILLFNEQTTGTLPVFTVSSDPTNRNKLKIETDYVLENGVKVPKSTYYIESSSSTLELEEWIINDGSGYNHYTLGNWSLQEGISFYANQNDATGENPWSIGASFTGSDFPKYVLTKIDDENAKLSFTSKELPDIQGENVIAQGYAYNNAYQSYTDIKPAPWIKAAQREFRRDGEKCITSVDFDSSFAKHQIIYTSYWFAHTGITQIDMTNLNLGSISDIRCMFYDCENLKEIKFGGTYNPIDMPVCDGVFGDCDALESVDFGGLTGLNNCSYSGLGSDDSINKITIPDSWNSECSFIKLFDWNSSFSNWLKNGQVYYYGDIPYISKGGTFTLAQNRAFIKDTSVSDEYQELSCIKTSADPFVWLDPQSKLEIEVGDSSRQVTLRALSGDVVVLTKSITVQTTYGYEFNNEYYSHDEKGNRLYRAYYIDCYNGRIELPLNSKHTFYVNELIYFDDEDIYINPYVNGQADCLYTTLSHDDDLDIKWGDYNKLEFKYGRPNVRWLYDGTSETFERPYPLDWRISETVVGDNAKGSPLLEQYKKFWVYDESGYWNYSIKAIYFDDSLKDGSYNLVSANNMFSLNCGVNFISNIDNLNLSNCTTMNYMFNECVNLHTVLGFNNVNLLKVKYASHMFDYCYHIYSFTKFPTFAPDDPCAEIVLPAMPSLENADYMFNRLGYWTAKDAPWGEKYQTIIDLSNMDFSNARSMLRTFYNLANAKIKFSNSINTSKVVNMQETFSTEWGPDSKERVERQKPLMIENMNKLNTSSVTTMMGMFRNTYVDTGWFKHADREGNDAYNLLFDTHNVNNMSKMFQNSHISEWTYESGKIIEKESYLDLHSLDTSNVSDMSYMFDQAEVYSTGSEIVIFSSSEVAENKFSTSSVVNMNYMFSGLSYYQPKLTNDNELVLDLSSFDTHNVFSCGHMFDLSLNTARNVKKYIIYADPLKWNMSKVYYVAGDSVDTDRAVLFLPPKVSETGYLPSPAQSVDGGKNPMTTWQNLYDYYWEKYYDDQQAVLRASHINFAHVELNEVPIGDDEWEIGKAGLLTDVKYKPQRANNENNLNANKANLQNEFKENVSQQKSTTSISGKVVMPILDADNHPQSIDANLDVKFTFNDQDNNEVVLIGKTDEAGNYSIYDVPVGVVGQLSFCKNGYYGCINDVTIGTEELNNMNIVVENKTYLDNYTWQELSEISKDIAINGANSIYMPEFVRYAQDNDVKAVKLKEVKDNKKEYLVVRVSGITTNEDLQMLAEKGIDTTNMKAGLEFASVDASLPPYEYNNPAVVLFKQVTQFLEKGPLHYVELLPDTLIEASDNKFNELDCNDSQFEYPIDTKNFVYKSLVFNI